MWWHVWSNHPTSTILCGCGDTSQFVWFLEWPAYALSHGLNPFYSAMAAYPHGVNLLSYTSVLAVGIPLAPITWIFGPVATLNVALLLSPVLSGMAMFIFLRRCVTWLPAAFVGGLAYGFSPIILTNLYFSHLNLTMSPIPPLVAVCLDEILIRQRRRPVLMGVLLGLLLTLQFFLSSELLFIIVLAGAFALVLIIVYAAWRRPEGLRRNARYGFVGLATGAIVAGVLLAYPVWFALAGPAHVSGLVWLDPAQYVNHLKSYVIPLASSPFGWLYGFNGVLISGQYLGLGLVVVLLGGLVAWRRDLKLWFFAVLGLVFLILSLGAANPLFGSLALVENILPNRFDQVVYLCAAIMLGIVVDHTFASVTRRYAVRSAVPEAPKASEQVREINPGTTDRAHQPRVSWSAALSGLTVAAIALVPIGFYLSQNVPIPVQSSLHVPLWFQTAARHLGPKQVLLVLPDNLSVESPLIWQVADGMRYVMADEVASLGTAKEPAGLAVLVNASVPAYANGSYEDADLTITPSQIAAVRSLFREWGVTTVVLPGGPGLVRLAQLSSVPAAAALITAATGQTPDYEQGAWVWADVKHPAAPLVPTASQFLQCTLTGLRGTAGVNAADACIAWTGPFLRIVPSANGLDLLQQRLFMSVAADSVAVKRVEFIVTGKGISGSVTVPAHPIVDGSLMGWIANAERLALPSGTYTLRSEADDAQGAIGRSPAVTMRVNDGNTSSALPPVTKMLNPAPHAQVRGTEPLFAVASSELGVKDVEFYVTGGGRTDVENATKSLLGASFLWNTRNVPNGTYTVYAHAEGNTGLTTTSKGVVVEVRNSGSRALQR
jgi:hypothetical protein